MAADEGSFLARWSRRKARAATHGDAPRPAALPPAVQDARAAPPADVLPAAAQGAPAPAQSSATAAPGAVPPPSLEDVALLTRDSDYTKFVAGGVTPEVRNAALKKLFSDPQFNVMDGLDTYVDDYHTPDPLPAGMLRRMVQSQMLGLFADETPATSTASAPTDSTDPTLAAPAAAPVDDPEPAAAPPPTQPACHEDADLQLQPDDDAGRAGPAPGPGADTRRQH
jgi:hypothetical protein